MSLPKSRLRDKCFLDAETADCWRTFSGRSARLPDNRGCRVTVKRQVTPTRRSHIQTPSIGRSFFDIPYTSKSDILDLSQSCRHIQAPTMGCTHIQSPTMGCTHIQAPTMGCTHIQAPTMGSTHSEIPSMSNSRTQTLSLDSSQIQTPIICSSHFQTSSLSSSHSKSKTPSMGNFRSSTDSEVNILMQTCTTGNPQDQGDRIDTSIDNKQRMSNPQEQGDRIDTSIDNKQRMSNPQEHTPSPSNPLEQNPSVDSPPDQGHPTDKSDAQNPSIDHKQERASSPSNTQGQAPPVNEVPDPPSPGSDSQTQVTCGDVVDILQSYKSGIHQLRLLRLHLVEDPTWFTIQANFNYHRSQRHSTDSKKRLKTLRANISQGKSLEQIHYLVNKHHRNGCIEDDFKNPHFDKYSLFLDQDRKNPLLQCSRQNHGTSKRLHEKDPRRQPETFISKELRANTDTPFTHAQSTVKYERGFIGQLLTASKSKKQIPDKKYFYKTVLDSSSRTYGGQHDQVKVLPRLRLTGLPDLAGDSTCKTATKSMTFIAGNQMVKDDGRKWGSGHEKFSSKWTNWKRWIGSTLNLRQTTTSVSGHSSVIKGGFGCSTGTFTPGDSRLHQCHDQLSDSCTDARHGNDADSSWYRRRRDPPASPADLDDFLSPVTRVVITTTERDCLSK